MTRGNRNMPEKLKRKVPHTCKPPTPIVGYEDYTEPGKWLWSKPVVKQRPIYTSEDMFYRCEHGAEWYWRAHSMYPYWQRVTDAPVVWEEISVDELEQP